MAREDNIATQESAAEKIKSTGRRIEISGVQVGRFENGQIVERWGSSDELGIMRQIGAVDA